MFKCVKGFMMEMAAYGGYKSRTIQFLVPPVRFYLYIFHLVFGFFIFISSNYEFNLILCTSCTFFMCHKVVTNINKYQSTCIARIMHQDLGFFLKFSLACPPYIMILDQFFQKCKTCVVYDTMIKPLTQPVKMIFFF